MSIAGTVMSIKGASDAADAAEETGRRQREAANFEAAQLDQNAGQALASSQRDAEEQRRQSRILQSRALALASASGAGATDPTVVNLISEIAREGVYRAGVAMYEGEDRARQMRMGAATARYQGDIALSGGRSRASAYRTQGFGSAIGATSLLAKYGGGGPRATGPSGDSNLLDTGITNPMVG